MKNFRCASYHSYEEIAPTLETGDIYLAHGNRGHSHQIEGITHSEWSHAGMIVLAADIGLTGIPTNILLWESTLSTALPDIITKRIKSGLPHAGGTVLVSFRGRVIADFSVDEATLAIRHLQVERTPEMFVAPRHGRCAIGCGSGCRFAPLDSGLRRERRWQRCC